MSKRTLLQINYNYAVKSLQCEWLLNNFYPQQMSIKANKIQEPHNKSFWRWL
jgi:hypothetical protein